MVPALRGSATIKGPAGAAVMACFYRYWKVATARLLAGAVRFQGHLWLIPMPLVEAIQHLTPSALCPDNHDLANLLEDALNLVEQFHLLATLFCLGSAEHPRGVVRFSRELTPEGALLFREGMGHEDFPYVSWLLPLERTALLEPRLEEEGPLIPGFGQELDGSGAAPCCRTGPTQGAGRATLGPGTAALTRFSLCI